MKAMNSIASESLHGQLFGFKLLGVSPSMATAKVGDVHGGMPPVEPYQVEPYQNFSIHSAKVGNPEPVPESNQFQA